MDIAFLAHRGMKDQAIFPPAKEKRNGSIWGVGLLVFPLAESSLTARNAGLDSLHSGIHGLTPVTGTQTEQTRPFSNRPTVLFAIFSTTRSETLTHRQKYNERRLYVPIGLFLSF